MFHGQIVIRHRNAKIALKVFGLEITEVNLIQFCLKILLISSKNLKKIIKKIFLIISDDQVMVNGQH